MVCIFNVCNRSAVGRLSARDKQVPENGTSCSPIDTRNLGVGLGLFVRVAV